MLSPTHKQVLSFFNPIDRDAVLKVLPNNLPPYVEIPKYPNSITLKFPLQQLSNELQQQIQRLPPIATIQPSITNIEQSEKCLNLHRNYSTHLQPSINEHLQNWKDRCQDLASEINKTDTLYIQTLFKNKLPRRNVSNFMKMNKIDVNGSVIYASTYKNIVGTEYLLGIIILLNYDENQLQKDANISVIFHNCNTILAPMILTMGFSTKTNDNSTAGQFGEGVKVEICRLLSQSTLSYYTNQSEWMFFFRDDILHMNVHHRPEVSEIHTTIVIRNFPVSFFSLQNYLLLFSHIPRIRSNHIEVILNPFFAGRVYNYGIAIQNFTSAFPFAINLIDKSLNSKMRIGRDRNSLNTAALGFFIPELFSYCSTFEKFLKLANTRLTGHEYEQILSITDSITPVQPSQSYPHLQKDVYLEFIFDFSDRIYKTLLEVKDEDSLFLQKATNVKSLVDMAESLLKIFQHYHGKTAIPIQQHTLKTEDDQSARILGASFVELPEVLFKYLSFSRSLPTLDDFWVNKLDLLLSLDEWITDDDQNDNTSQSSTTINPTPSNRYPYVCKYSLFPSAEANQFAKEIKSHVNDLLHPIITAKQIRFKNFSGSPCNDNIRRVIPLDYHGTILFLIDTRFFEIEMIHQSYAARDSSFECSELCCCRHSIVTDDIETVLKQKCAQKGFNGMDVERFLSKRYKQRYFASRAISLPTPFRPKATTLSPSPSPSPPPSSPLVNREHSPSTSRGNSRSNLQNELKIELSDEGDDEDDTFTYIPSSSDNNNHLPPIHHPLNIINKITENATSSSIGGTATTFNSNHCRELIDLQIDDRIVAPFGFAAFHRTISTKFSSLPQSTNSIYGVEDVGDQIHPVYFFEFGATIYLLSLIFCYPQSSIHIFSKCSKIIAFNHHVSSSPLGDLYFNYYYFECFLSQQSLTNTTNHETTLVNAEFKTNPFSILDYWFVIFCHEIAHNDITNHSALFASKMGDVLTFYSHKFRTLLLHVFNDMSRNFSLYECMLRIITRSFNLFRNPFSKPTLPPSVAQKIVNQPSGVAEWIYIITLYLSIGDHSTAERCLTNASMLFQSDNRFQLFAHRFSRIYPIS